MRTLSFLGFGYADSTAAAASVVDDEPLSGDFSGILGLALPQNSVIANEIPPVTGNQPDGAVFASNLFTMTPSASAPSARFLSLTLARPEANGGGIPSLLGIGKHPPTTVVSDPAKVQYNVLSSPAEGSGPYYWQPALRGISVWVDGVEKVVNVGSGAGQSATAVVDSGMPIILASVTIANGIYGALGIGPGSDGQCASMVLNTDQSMLTFLADYIPCTTPLNMSLTLDSRTAIPLHPLDLSTESSSSSGNNCLGLIQAYPPSSSLSQIADIILGVPFMRSTYTVMAYDPPDAHGVFPNATTGGSALSAATIRPRLGLLGLTDATQALEEFHTVRVLNQPLQGGGANQANGGGGGSRQLAVDSGKKLSVGLEVLIGLLGFFALCFILFAARWAVHKRKLAQLRKHQLTHGHSESTDSKGDEYVMHTQTALSLARQSTLTSRYGPPSEDTLRSKRFTEYKRRDSELSRAEVQSGYTDDTARTRVVDADDEKGKDGLGEEWGDELKTGHRELGFRRSRADSGFQQAGDAIDADTWTNARATLVDPHHRHSHEDHAHEGTPLTNDDSDDINAGGYRDEPTHVRIPSVDAAGVAVPLLAHTRGESRDSLGAVQRTPLGLGRPSSRARVGSIGSDSTRDRLSSMEFGVTEERRVSGVGVNRDSVVSMAGIGTHGARGRMSSFGEPRPQHSPRSPSMNLASPLLSPPPLVNLSLSNDSSQVSLSAETTNGHGGAS